MFKKLEDKLDIRHKEDFTIIHERPELKKKLIYLVILHYLVIVANGVTFVVTLPLFIWFMGPLGFFPAITLMVVVFNLAYHRIECPATRMENELRVKLGLPKIKTFVAHYRMKKKEK